MRGVSRAVVVGAAALAMSGAGFASARPGSQVRESPACRPGEGEGLEPPPA
ncbi:hypothetical protein [Saccharopolyspora cebuensis]|uniref:Uncharacterized protein n=1 Tax=Saccharopolyspora cebuensis TaxID=418759 RepID=A0ABV4CLW4_9PSEU